MKVDCNNISNPNNISNLNNLEKKLTKKVEIKSSDLSIIKIGVLALQGAFREHIKMLDKLKIKNIEIKYPEQLMEVDGLIIPGGESTTIFKLIEKYNFKIALDEFHRQKKPIFGTCAGLIILAKEVINEDFGLGYIDIVVDRNAYGRQIESFEQIVNLKFNSNFNYNNSGENKNFKAIFIRAPKIKKKSHKVLELCNLDGITVLARQENILVCAFHPELTDDLRIHEYFAYMVYNRKIENLKNLAKKNKK